VQRHELAEAEKKQREHEKTLELGDREYGD